MALSIGTRPDCLEPEKLELLSRLNKRKPVWIELGLQTIHESTAAYIRRGYPLSCFEDAVRRLRQENIEVIVHTILGLPGEDTDSVENTLRQVKELSPESLTVHTLAIKRAANLNIEMDKYRDTLKSDIDSQLGAVTRAAAEMGLDPYYLYRQKNMTGNLENVGYSKPGLECLYNILIMEERTDIIGLGAGSSSKLVVRPGHDGVTEGTRIDRIENCKSVDDYIARIDEMIERKKAGFIWD